MNGHEGVRRVPASPRRRQLIRDAVGLGLAAFGGGLAAGCTSQMAPYFSANAGDQIETTQIRLSQIPGICIAPQYVAADVLKAEGFTEVQYIPIDPTNQYAAFLTGEVDISMAFVAPFIAQLDAGVPIVLLGGVHVGCFELFGNDKIHAIRDLKGKSVGIPGLGPSHHMFLASMAAYVGLDPRVDINWHIHAPADSAQVLADGEVDALIGFPPVPQELRAKKIGRVIVNSSLDRPWSQYFCCTLAANRAWVQAHPVAAKRALRAILKAADICDSEPERAARAIVDGGFTANYGYALQTMQEVPYNRWRDFDPEDSVRFYSLRLQEIGMIKSTPDQIISKGTDWRFLNELRQELKS